MRHYDLGAEFVDNTEMTDAAASTEDSIMNTLISLKQGGMHIPLSISLIFKNIQALNMMSQDAGFNSIVDAYRSISTPADMLRLALRFH